MENTSLDDIDLNEAPFSSENESVPLLDGIDANRSTERRIEYLAFLTARARYRQRRRVLPAENESFPTDPAVHASGDGDVDLSVTETGGMANVRNMETGGMANERNVERGKSCTRERIQLVAKALEMDTEVEINSQEDGGGNFYDCNICLYIAREPILTCCGHLFCWACFYKLPYADSFMKECPVCNGEVTDSTIVPIYGNGDCPRESKLESSTVIPHRPRAQRVESSRQQRAARGGFHIPVTEVLRRIRTSIGAINDDREQEAGNVDLPSGNNSQGGSGPSIREAVSIGVLEQQLSRTQHLSRVLTESGDSLSYISAALNSAERLVEDLEFYINLLQLRRRNSQILSPIDEDDSIDNRDDDDAAATTSQTSPDEIITVAPGTGGVSVDFGQTENPGTGSGGVELNLQPPSSRRRSSSRLSSLIAENDASNGTRRRRLR